jgi:hypothetical protein
MPCSRCGKQGHNVRTCQASEEELKSKLLSELAADEEDEIVSCSEDEPEPEFNTSAPNHWTSESPIVTLDPNSAEYKNILKDFNKSFPNNPTIISVKRLQYYVKYMQYQLEKKRMALIEKCPIENVKELTLYHGTSSSSVDSINKNGFNRTFGSVQAYGDGVYFARDAVMSSKKKYAKPDEKGHQIIYITKVLVGHSALGRGGMKIPPDRKPGIPYDSLVNCLNSPTIYVSGHNDNQMYAEYLVEFKLRDTRVSRFGSQVGYLEIQNMDSCQYELYKIPKRYRKFCEEYPEYNKEFLVDPDHMNTFKNMIHIKPYEILNKNVLSNKEVFIIVKNNNNINKPNKLIEYILYKDNPNKKMSVAIIQGKLVHL